MKMILEIRYHGDEDQSQHMVFEKPVVTLGRGFDNDVIVSDPYVSAHHLRIQHDGSSFYVYDIESENGFTVNGQTYGHHVAVRAGDVLELGHTEVRIYTPDYPVPPAQPLHRSGAFLSWINKPLNVWLCFLIAVGTTLGWSYLEIWVDEMGRALAAAALAAIGVIVLWSAIWAVAGRLTRHKARYRGHTALISLYIVAGTIAWYIEAYIDFLTNENWLASLTTYSLNFILLALLLYGSFTLATRMPRRRRVFSAGFFSFGIVTGVFIFTLVSSKSFNQQPLYPATLEPYLSGLAPADDIATFMKGSRNIFASDTFADRNTGTPAAPATPASTAPSTPSNH